LTVLDQLRALLFDDQVAGAEFRIRILLVLLVNGLEGLGLDTGLNGIVDAAEQVAVRMGDSLWFEQACEQSHRSPFRSV
jgi:hypothetical protein